ncbi:hypothetical protein [Streptacidiphilus carbonis]|uniref:hypothetical protein n=1 Tax=Streptacidiphilus carbonis TaxID=105422 RepID=UPI0005A8920E|nr:hypothetical protein [Streptacidiphilus carbonis]
MADQTDSPRWFVVMPLLDSEDGTEPLFQRAGTWLLDSTTGSMYSASGWPQQVTSTLAHTAA